MKSTAMWLSGLAFLAASQVAAAQDLGEARAGLAYAEQVCAECHAVRSGRGPSPHERAPTFESVANTRGMTAMALRVWLVSPHPSMPHLVLDANDTDNVVAYILSLKKR